MPPRGCAFAHDEQPEGCLSQSSSATSLEEDEEPLTPPTPMAAHDFSDASSPESAGLPKRARSFSHDDILQCAPSTHCPSSPRPRLHRRGHSRGTNPIIQLAPHSPDGLSDPPRVQTTELQRHDDVFASPTRCGSDTGAGDGSATSSTQSSPSTVWPQGDPHPDALSPCASPPSKKAFPSSSNALNLEGVPPPGEAAGQAAPPPANSSNDNDASDLRVHQRSASSTGIYGPLAHLEKRGPLIRKKSGEPVRSSLKSSPFSRHAELAVQTLEIKSRRDYRTKSAPSTPLHKNVHFSSELEQVKHFMAQQRPNAVSRSGSPEETTEEESEGYPFPSMSAIHKVTLQLPNFTKPPLITPKETRDVLVTSIMLHSDTKTLRGSIAVRNIAFHKRVVVRFTLDDWQTTSEVAADYAKNLSAGTYDEWNFSIKLSDFYARIEDRKLIFAVRYCTDGREIWDNNGGRNYVATFKKTSGSSPSLSPSSAATRVRRPASQRARSDYEWTASIRKPAESKNHVDDLQTSLDKLLNDEPVRTPKFAAKGTKVLSSRYDFGSAPRTHPAKTSSLSELAPLMGNATSPLLSPRTVPPSAPLDNNGSLENTPTPTNTMRPIYSGRSFPLAHPDVVSSLYADATDDSDFGSDLSYRHERFNSFPPTSFSVMPRAYDDKEESEHVELSSPSPFAGGKRPASPPPAREPLSETASPPSSDASYASPISPTTSLESPNLHQLQLSMGSGGGQAGGPVQSYAGFLERYASFCRPH